MRRQEELRRLEELRNQELHKRKQMEMRYIKQLVFSNGFALGLTFNVRQHHTKAFFLTYESKLSSFCVIFIRLMDHSLHTVNKDNRINKDKRQKSTLHIGVLMLYLMIIY